MNENQNIQLNSNEIVCPKCGAIGTEEHLFCAVCGTPLKGDNNTSTVNNVGSGTVYLTSKTDNPTPVNPANDRGYIPWVITAYLAAPCGLLLSFLSGINLLIGGFISLVSAIYAKVQYPNVPIVKFTFWFIIIIYIVSIVAFLFLIYLFVSACASCANGLS